MSLKQRTATTTATTVLFASTTVRTHSSKELYSQSTVHSMIVRVVRVVLIVLCSQSIVLLLNSLYHTVFLCRGAQDNSIRTLINQGVLGDVVDAIKQVRRILDEAAHPLLLLLSVYKSYTSVVALFCALAFLPSTCGKNEQIEQVRSATTLSAGRRNDTDNVISPTLLLRYSLLAVKVFRLRYRGSDTR